MIGVWYSGEEYRYLLNRHIRNAVESARRSSTIFWSKAVMLHWGGRGRATCMGKRPLERGSTRGSVCVCVCVCVCVYAHMFHPWQIPLDKRLRVCVRTHVPTVADTALLFRLCHPPHQNVGWEWPRHLGLCNDTAALRSHPSPHRRWLNRPQRAGWRSPCKTVAEPRN